MEVDKNVILTKEEQFKVIRGVDWKDFKARLTGQDAQKLESYLDNDWYKIAKAQHQAVVKLLMSKRDEIARKCCILCDEYNYGTQNCNIKDDELCESVLEQANQILNILLTLKSV